MVDVRRTEAFVALLAGVVFGLSASGSLQWVPFVLRAPHINSSFSFPVIAFGVLAAALWLRPRFLNHNLIQAGTVALGVFCTALLPFLVPAGALDGQSGMFEAWVAMATLPLAAMVLGLATLAAAHRRRNVA